MKLLIVTQVVDNQDPVLGFFITWVKELAAHYENIEVICLKAGRHSLPSNVHVHSLGKERGVSRIHYLYTFYKYIWVLRRQYNAVFVHMNQEYVLLAGVFWKLFRKRVYLWRNHYAGSWLTDLAASLCDGVFYTSAYSYTARYPQAHQMPVGIDSNRFTPAAHKREPNTILFLARISPSKRLDLLIAALATLQKEGAVFSADVYGSALPADASYAAELITKTSTLGLAPFVTFHAGIPNEETPNIYRSHDIFVNTSPSGMFDKTLFEAASCGAIVLSSSEDFKSELGEDLYFSTAEELAQKLKWILEEKEERKEQLRMRLSELARKNDIQILAKRLVIALDADAKLP